MVVLTVLVSGVMKLYSLLRGILLLSYGVVLFMGVVSIGTVYTTELIRLLMLDIETTPFP